MPQVFNRSRERAIIHVVKGADGKIAETIVIPPDKLTSVSDENLVAIRSHLSIRQNLDLVVGDDEIAKARSSMQALINAETAKANAALAENADLKKRIEALEKLVGPEKSGKAA